MQRDLSKVDTGYKKQDYETLELTENKGRKTSSTTLEKSQEHFVAASRFIDFFKESTNNGEAGAANEIAKRRQTIANKFCLSPKIEYNADSFKLYQEIISNKAKSMYKSALESYETGSYESCFPYLQKALVMEPNNVKYYVLRGDAFLQLCDYKSAILNYKRVCILEPESEEYFTKLASIYFLQGQCCYDEEMYLDALESFTRAADMKPENKDYHAKRISCLASLKRHQECLALINERLEVESNNPDLFILRARLHLFSGDSTLSYFDVKEALSVDPQNKEAGSMHQNLEENAELCKEKAIKFDMCGKPKEAIMKISHAININPSVTEYLVLRAGMHRRNLDFSAAVDDLLLAMEKLNHDPDVELYVASQKQLLLTFNDFAVDCFNKGFYEEAVALLKKAIKGEKQDKALYSNRGDCFYKLGNIHFALLDYQQAQELAPNDKSINLRLSVVYNDLGIMEYKDRKYDRAEEYFSLAISLNITVSAFYLSRARSRYMQEKIDEAKIDVISALYFDASNKEAFSMFARLFPAQTIEEAIKSDFGMLIIEALILVIQENSKDEKETDHINKVKPLPGISEPPKEAVVLKKCMEDKQFNFSIIKGKKKVNELVESVIRSRQDLSSRGPKITSPPNHSKKSHQKKINIKASSSYSHL
ncbi:tetratricopeptide repeat protein 16-like [Hydractinia symbiolongicarpus]|uniref:tetratricopeptide repeat protein 16-like n=1 Tax=Hydractinia symbiolongicarpus TaxID=13093 RepID=UPI00254C651A|nr:tetratricopeptide repeat protein 16-like [Hydractinia symbiolongicarpus]XP_057317417.1 tetratricopeptide repeat protein 16-like [Hydractinia symbiolongicarpus]XP_057317418.1 tetratricopeptide repeat protein 16-like [Hydractinia symbiolongicarpus]